MSKNIMSRIATAAIATAALTFTGAALAPAAFATEAPTTDVIEYANDDSAPYVSVNLDGEPITIDRSHLTRDLPVADETPADDGSDMTFWHIDLDSLNVGGQEIETGEGYQNIVPLGGAIEIEPISAEIAPATNGLPGAAIGGIVAGGAVVVAGAAWLVLKNKGAKATA